MRTSYVGCWPRGGLRGLVAPDLESQGRYEIKFRKAMRRAPASSPCSSMRSASIPPTGARATTSRRRCTTHGAPSVPSCPARRAATIASTSGSELSARTRRLGLPCDRPDPRCGVSSGSRLTARERPDREGRAHAWPRHPAPFPDKDPDAPRAIEAWLASDPAIADLRARGLWSNLNDSVARFAPFSRSVEHRAQQPRLACAATKPRSNAARSTAELLDHHGDGRRHRVVSTVFMANVPPSASLLSQRVGRRGPARTSGLDGVHALPETGRSTGRPSATRCASSPRPIAAPRVALVQPADRAEAA